MPEEPTVIEMNEDRLINSAKAAISGLINDNVVAVAIGWDERPPSAGVLLLQAMRRARRPTYAAAVSARWRFRGSGCDANGMRIYGKN